MSALAIPTPVRELATLRTGYPRPAPKLKTFRDLFEELGIAPLDSRVAKRYMADKLREYEKLDRLHNLSTAIWFLALVVALGLLLPAVGGRVSWAVPLAFVAVSLIARRMMHKFAPYAAPRWEFLTLEKYEKKHPGGLPARAAEIVEAIRAEAPKTEFFVERLKSDPLLEIQLSGRTVYLYQWDEVPSADRGVWCVQ